jgi:hypothetical protein
MATHRIKSLRLLAPTAVVVGAFSLAACSGSDPRDTVEVSSGNRAAHLTKAERYAELQQDRGSRACKWNSVGAPPTPESILVLENCDGEWTGNMEWVQPRSAGATRGLVEPPGRVEP